MIISVINFKSVSFCEFKSYSPIPGYFHSPSVFLSWFKFMQARSGKIHIGGTIGGIKQIKNKCKFLAMFLINTLFVSSKKKPFQTAVLKTLYHYGFSLPAIM